MTVFISVLTSSPGTPECLMKIFISAYESHPCYRAILGLSVNIAEEWNLYLWGFASVVTPPVISRLTGLMGESSSLTTAFVSSRVGKAAGSTWYSVGPREKAWDFAKLQYKHHHGNHLCGRKDTDTHVFIWNECLGHRKSRNVVDIVGGYLFVPVTQT